MTEVEVQPVAPVEEKPMEVEKESEVLKRKADGAETPEKEAPAAKKAKVAVDMSVLKRQIEYYFSDLNLEGDAFFHEKISKTEGGWLKMEYLLSCKKVKAMGATAEDIVEALKDSPLETQADGVRRTQPLPELKKKSTGPRFQKEKKNAHDGGVVFKVSGVPEGKKWGDVKDVIKVKLPAGSKIIFATSLKEADCSTTMLASPFDNDKEFFESLEISIEDKKLAVSILEGDDLRKALSDMPKHVQKRREMSARDRAKARQKPIILAEQKFPNIGSLRAKVKEILAARQAGTALKNEAPDFLLIKAVLQYHPRAAEKLKGMAGLKVDKHPQHDSRCFCIVFEDGSSDDVSMMKCFAEIEQNPPLAPEPVKPEAKKEKKAEEPKAEEKKAEEPKAEEPKAEEKKTEEPKAEEKKAEEAKAEEPKAEEAKAEEPKAEEAKAEEPAAEKQE